MDVSTFVLDNIIKVISGVIFVITALLTFIGKIVFTKIIEREKATLQEKLETLKTGHAKDLEILKSNFQVEFIKRDQFHQISKSTFEKLFDQKIKTYTRLLSIQKNYDKLTKESCSGEFIDSTKEISQYYESLKKELEENSLYISNELSDKFDNWYFIASSFFQDIDKVQYEGQQDGNTKTSETESIQQAMYDKREYIMSNLISATDVQMSALLQQISDDIKEIRKSINTIQNT
jgi:hypothetical protein